MRVLLFRHAEKENSIRGNPPLNPNGLRQAKKIAELVQGGQLPAPTKLFSSPKLRAQQTLHALRDTLKLEILTRADLDERHNSEPVELFQKRVARFLTELEVQLGSVEDIVYFTTHLDWIEEALLQIQSDIDLTADRFQSWLPAQFLEFEVNNGLWIFHSFRST